ncbi:GNAT family N-acetyltransferase [Actinoplanes sp. NPDC000266]
MIVRAATPDDAEALAEVNVRAWRAGYRGLVPQDYLDRMTPADRRPVWERMVREPAMAIFVAEGAAGGVVGYIRVSAGRDADTDPRLVGEVQALYVRPDSWKLGAGRALMDRGVRRLAGDGYREYILWVLAANERARRFYEAAGWRPDGSMKTDGSRGFPLTEARYRRDARAGVRPRSTVMSPREVVP